MFPPDAADCCTPSSPPVKKRSLMAALSAHPHEDSGRTAQNRMACHAGQPSSNSTGSVSLPNSAATPVTNQRAIPPRPGTAVSLQALSAPRNPPPGLLPGSVTHCRASVLCCVTALPHPRQGRYTGPAWSESSETRGQARRDPGGCHRRGFRGIRGVYKDSVPPPASPSPFLCI